ncbi:hypothetical protein H2203_008874 [Taxawa tesnikishii (nom. ined.)]|nr:hypothetical protein H2203_008874 [Dothideales sp. JES 119]
MDVMVRMARNRTEPDAATSPDIRSDKTEHADPKPQDEEMGTVLMKDRDAIPKNEEVGSAHNLDSGFGTKDKDTGPVKEP